ncbi:helix-turn-helix domain-containing protein [Rubripirellula sp.]|nr:helix-turn-helix domain-containing protein [Rubripirellula sp.]MDB4634099.1 helix-turn-helix domain-containing protein [Rubripirellula sp.]
MSKSESGRLSYPPLLTKAQVAELFSTSTRTIDRWLLAEEIPAGSKLIIGGSVRFRTDVLLAYITSTRTSGGDA